MEKEKLSKFEKKIESAIFGPKILRNRLGIEIMGPQNWKQNYQVLYKNVSKQLLTHVLLAPRVKKVQRNLSVYDNKKNNLAIVPSHIVGEALCGICEYYVSKANEAADKKENEIVKELIDNPIKFNIIFSNDNDNENDIEGYGKETQSSYIQETHQRLIKIASQLEMAGKAQRDSYFHVDRILSLVSRIGDFYLPIVELETPVEKEECVFLNYSVENLEKESIIGRSFFLTGTLTITFPLEVERSISNHVIVLSPDGMLFRHAGVSGIEEPDLKRKYGNLKKSLDDNMIYFRIPPEDAEKIYRLWRQPILDEENSEAHTCDKPPDEKNISKKNERPVVEVNIGISRDFPRRLPLVRILTALAYISILIPAIVMLIFKSHVDTSLFMETLILEVTILVSLGIYAMEKSFLHEYIAAQVIILFIMFIAEVVSLHLFC